MKFHCEAEVVPWEVRAQEWFFAALPADVSEEIREFPRMPRGFGAVAVVATIGTSTWRTSIFPDAQRGTYVLPLKKTVRIAENIRHGDWVTLRLDVSDG